MTNASTNDQYAYGTRNYENASNGEICTGHSVASSWFEPRSFFYLWNGDSSTTSRVEKEIQIYPSRVKNNYNALGTSN